MATKYSINLDNVDDLNIAVDMHPRVKAAIAVAHREKERLERMGIRSKIDQHIDIKGGKYIIEVVPNQDDVAKHKTVLEAMRMRREGVQEKHE